MLAQLVAFVFNVYLLGLAVFTICSWVNYPQIKKFYNWLRPWYEPLLQRLRRVIKPLRVGTTYFDFTPLVAMIGIVIARKVLMALLLMPY